jgi:hypothetical protein
MYVLGTLYSNSSSEVELPLIVHHNFEAIEKILWNAALVSQLEGWVDGIGG